MQEAGFCFRKFIFSPMERCDFPAYNQKISEEDYLANYLDFKQKKIKELDRKYSPIIVVDDDIDICRICEEMKIDFINFDLRKIF